MGVGLDQRKGLEVGVDSLKVGVDQQADGADRPHHLPPPPVQKRSIHLEFVLMGGGALEGPKRPFIIPPPRARSANPLHW